MADSKTKESCGSLSTVKLGDVKIAIDVSEALSGLKAVQREARAATRALRELEAEYDTREGSVIDLLSKSFGMAPLDIGKLSHKEQAFLLACISTKDLTDELKRRPNVMYRKKSDLIEPIPKGFTLVVADD